MSELGDTVAILPWSYKNGKEVAQQSAREICNQLLLATGFNVFLVKSPTGAMPPAMPGNNAGNRGASPFAHLMSGGRSMLGLETSTRADSPVFELPTPEQMIVIGEKLGVRFVIAGRAQWSSRYVWIGISNRIKSICSVDLLIMDMDDRHLVLNARDVLGDSTEKKNPYNTITSAISLNPLPLILPGSNTPQEQRAVTVAIAKAMEPWLKSERIRAALAQADLSSEMADSGGRLTPEFSTLVSSVSDLHLSLHVTEENQQQLEAIDKDLAKLYALGDVNLTYQDPNMLRLEANSPKDGHETLLVNEEDRSFVEPERKIDHQQDLSSTPERRLALSDLCGLLPTGMFDYMRARFVRQENRDGVNAVVYDLTYWGVDDGPYHRIWIDPKTRTLVRNEAYDRGGKLKTIYLYKQPVEVAPQVWVPTRIEMENAQHRTIVAIRVSGK